MTIKFDILFSIVYIAFKPTLLFLEYHNVLILKAEYHDQQCRPPFFHAVTGCDTVSYFAGKGKKTAFQVWKSNLEVTDIFRLLSSPQDTVSEEQCRVLGRFVVVMYSRTCPHQTVNEARQALFAQGNKSIENIPPTQAPLAQHINRVIVKNSSPPPTVGRLSADR